MLEKIEQIWYMNAIMTKSNLKNKKFKVEIYDGASQAGGQKKVKTIHFGDTRYEDFTIHRDQERKKRYLNRHKNDYNTLFYPSYWSKTVLWNKPTIRESLKDVSIPVKFQWSSWSDHPDQPQYTYVNITICFKTCIPRDIELDINPIVATESSFYPSFSYVWLNIDTPIPMEVKTSHVYFMALTHFDSGLSLRDCSTFCSIFCSTFCSFCFKITDVSAGYVMTCSNVGIGYYYAFWKRGTYIFVIELFLS